MLSYPTKTAYTVGECFDTRGLKVVFNTGETVNDVSSDKIIFYTSKTVKLTQGCPFETTGKKVVELKQPSDIAKLFDFDVDWRHGKAWIEPDVSAYTED